MTAALLPLGATRRTDLDFAVAPTPGLAFTAEGAVALLTEWGVPLVAMLALGATTSLLDETLWMNGPTTRGVLEGAGLLVPDLGHGPPRLIAPLPPLDALALGAVEALASNIVVSASPTLDIAVVDDGAGRKGLRLAGVQEIDAGDMTVSMSFGYADWLDDPDAGVTLWLIETRPGRSPALNPGLEAVGLGAMLANTDQSALLSGPLTIGRAGGLVFFALDLLDPTGQPDVVRVGDRRRDRPTARPRSRSNPPTATRSSRSCCPPELQAPFQLAVSARAGRGLELSAASARRRG